MTLACQVCSAAGQWHQGLFEEEVLRQRLAGRRDQPCVWSYLTWIPNHMTFGSHLALLLRFLIYQMAAVVDWVAQRY